MSEWEDKLNTLISDPDAMAQVMQMAQSLSQQMGQTGGAAPPPSNGAATPPPSSPLPSGVDPALIQRLLPLLFRRRVRHGDAGVNAVVVAKIPVIHPSALLRQQK